MLSLSSFAAHGAGFALIENSASGMGNAYAGAAAIAEDGSTIYFNPAGMTELEGTQLTGALHWVRPRGEFTNDGSTVASGGSLSGGNGGNNGVDAIIPNLYYSTEINDGMVFGLGINVPFGMESSYEDDWVGRYHAVDSSVMSVNINPSLAWKINEQLSFGAGISGQYIRVKLTSAIDFGAICQALAVASCNDPQERDGFVKLDADDFSWGYNFGLLYKPQPSTHIGFSYRSKITHSVSGDADFSDVPAPLAASFPDTTLSSSVSLPESSSFSISHQVDQFTLLFDWTYTRWSRFKELRIDYDSSQPDSVTTENWGDSSRYAIGLNYQLNPSLLLRSG
ncbi:Long-chain fatty acid transport protein, partial [hydrothermal vent metagenome]